MLSYADPTHALSHDATCAAHGWRVVAGYDSSTVGVEGSGMLCDLYVVRLSFFTSSAAGVFSGLVRLALVRAATVYMVHLLPHALLVAAVAYQSA